MSTEPFQHLPLHSIAVIERALEKRAHKNSVLEVVGTGSPVALAALLESRDIERLGSRHLILVPDQDAMDDLTEAIQFFNPQREVLQLGFFDVNPYSGLYPSTQQIARRLRWLHEASSADSDAILIATAAGLAQKTLPRSVFNQARHAYRAKQDLPSDFSRQLSRLGYQSAPLVEDIGSFAVRGGIVDIFSPAHSRPVRLDLFGDSIESIRFFDVTSQRSEEETGEFTLLPARETFYNEASESRALRNFISTLGKRPVNDEDRNFVEHNLRQSHFFPGQDFLLPCFFDGLESPLSYAQSSRVFWRLGPIEIGRASDHFFEDLKSEFEKSDEQAIRPNLDSLFSPLDFQASQYLQPQIELSTVSFDNPDTAKEAPDELRLRASNFKFSGKSESAGRVNEELMRRLLSLREEGQSLFVSTHTSVQAQRIGLHLERGGLKPQICEEKDAAFVDWLEKQSVQKDLVHIIPRALPENLNFAEENIIFLTEGDILGRKQRRKEAPKKIVEKLPTVAIADLNPSDRVVHVLHGIGIYEGLKVMSIEGAESEFIQVAYKDNDRLYLPIYRIAQLHKYSGPSDTIPLDKLGGSQWNKTKSKVKNHLRELAMDLLQLYAKRSQMHRPAFLVPRDEYEKFSDAFPYDETVDQNKAIGDIYQDMVGEKPMDRLVCGDVGFGKTEVAMRAAFHAIQARKQVAVLAPTTVLCFQHLETFQKRFKSWPVEIRALNRFVTPADSKKTLEGLKGGQVDLVIGTHRLLSKDIEFKDLGLLIIDEEQRFGVTHKEKVRKLKTSVDTLTLSATPIPRTLNMSLVGMRDLSLINTAPIDRLPTRTFICKYDDETIRRAMTAEIQRGGQIFFIHNRVQSIYGVADEISKLMPEARIKVGHGQMQEHELEQVMVAFYKHEIDILICTTIIESGIDNPRANTMFIDNAHAFGLSQLYQLRGRVGRSKDRAYCYLLIPSDRRLEKDAQERLKVIQENTALGSGIRIAQHDLELRGAGDILGEEQSGQIDAVGYELYLELLEEALATAKGEELVEQIEPEINIRIPALIPSDYMPDLRLRLSYYKAMSDIKEPSDMDVIEEQLADQFGRPPVPVFNLMGLMLIRHHCKELGIRDLSSGPKSISLAFTQATPLPGTEVVGLATSQPKRYSLTPDMRLIVRLDEISWMQIYEELLGLRKLCPAL